jgi:RNA polymerase sigma-70 factor (ECF subfamily)
MLAGLDGDAAAHKALLTTLSAHLRAYFKPRLARFGMAAADTEDLVQEALTASTRAGTRMIDRSLSLRGCMRSLATGLSIICADRRHL